MISVSATETETGPDICIRGSGFSPNGSVNISYLDIPAPVQNRPGPFGTVSANGTFLLKDTSMDRFGLNANCTNEQIQQNVVVSARDGATGNLTYATVPGGYWCANAPVSTDFNGGCH
jgi:hypothetical protein